MAGDAAAHRGAYPLCGCRNLFLRVELAYAARCFEIFPDGRRLSGVSDAFPCCRISKQAASDIMLPVRSLYVHRHVLGSIRADISKRSNRTGILSGLGRQHDPVPPAPAGPILWNLWVILVVVAALPDASPGYSSDFCRELLPSTLLCATLCGISLLPRRFLRASGRKNSCCSCL